VQRAPPHPDLVTQARAAEHDGRSLAGLAGMLDADATDLLAGTSGLSVRLPGLRKA
jgi:hypothetical protein